MALGRGAVEGAEAGALVAVAGPATVTGLKAWKEARLEGVIPRGERAAAALPDWCSGDEDADSMAGPAVGGGGGEGAAAAAVAADDEDDDDKEDESSSGLSKTRRVGEGEEPDSSDRIPEMPESKLRLGRLRRTESEMVGRRRR